MAFYNYDETKTFKTTIGQAVNLAMRMQQNYVSDHVGAADEDWNQMRDVSHILEDIIKAINKLHAAEISITLDAPHATRNRYVFF